MNVVMDTSCLQRTQSGVSVLTKGLLEGLQRFSDRVSVHCASPALNLRRYGRLAGKLDTLVNDLLWREHALPREVHRVGADVFHAPFLRVPNSMSVPMVAHVHDLYTSRHPEVFTRWSSLQYQRNARAMQRVSALLCVSHFTRSELIEFHPELNPSRIHVVHNAVSDRFYPRPKDDQEQVRERYGLERPFFLVVGTIEPRKNVLMLLDAFLEAAPEIDHDLVLIGAEGWVPSYVREVNSRIANQSRIRRPGFVPEEDLAVLYSAASAYLYPTLYEGFGLPLLEAMRSECPVLASEGSSLEEVSGGHACHLPAKEPGAWTEQLVSLGKGQFSVDLSAGRRWAEKFTWEENARQTIEIYQKVLEL